MDGARKSFETWKVFERDFSCEIDLGDLAKLREKIGEEFWDVRLEEVSILEYCPERQVWFLSFCVSVGRLVSLVEGDAPTFLGALQNCLLKIPGVGDSMTGISLTGIKKNGIIGSLNIKDIKEWRSDVPRDSQVILNMRGSDYWDYLIMSCCNSSVVEACVSAGLMGLMWLKNRACERIQQVQEEDEEIAEAVSEDTVS